MSGPNSDPRQGQGTYRTPKPFLDAVLRRLGRTAFDVDLACSTHDCVGRFGLAIDAGCDSLMLDWADFTGLGWCNPPFGLSKDFAAKFATAGLEVAALIPVALGAKWWRRYVHGIADVMWAGRLRFNLPDGTPMPAGINRDVALLWYNGQGPSGRYLLEDWRTW